MDPPSTRAGRPPRLNPFILPAETTARLLTLILALLAASLFVYSVMWWAYGFDDRQVEELRTCVSSALVTSPRTVADLGPKASELRRCTDPVNRSKAPWVIGGLGVLGGVSVVSLFVIPVWKRRRRRLRPLTDDDAPDVPADLAALSERAGLKRSPRFVWNPLSGSTGALAYGYPGRHEVALGGGLVRRFYTDRPAFRAVALHELAHVRSGDVSRAYLTIAAWWAFVALAAVPFIITLFKLNYGAGYAWGVAWRAVILVGLVYLTRNAVLRTREMYADALAATWEGNEGALARVLGGMSRPSGGRIQRYLRVHPDSAERLSLLERTEPLFRAGFFESLAVGVGAGVAYPTLYSFLGGLVGGDGSMTGFLSALVLAPLVTGAVGLGLWRAAAAALALGTSPPSGLASGVGLGLGLSLGFGLAFDSAFPVRTSTYSLDLLSLDWWWLTALLTVAVLFTRWIVAGATVWLAATAPGKGLRFAATIGLALNAFAFAAGLGALILINGSVNSAIEVILQQTELTHGTVDAVVPAGPLWLWWILWHPFTVFVAHQPWVLAALVVLWGLPFSAWFLRRRAAELPAERFLLDPPKSRSPRATEPLRPRLAILVGLAAGGAYFVCDLVGRALLWHGVAQTTRDRVEFGVAFYTWHVEAAVLLQMAIALGVAAAVSRHGAIHGLLAAFVGGVVMGVALLVAQRAAGCLGISSDSRCLVWGYDTPFLRQVYENFVGIGGLLAIPAAALGGLLGAGLRRLRTV